MAVNGTSTPTTAVLDEVLANLQVNQKVSVSIVRGGKRMKVAVTLGQFPAGNS